jgi:hypothetical protein
LNEPTGVRAALAMTIEAAWLMKVPSGFGGIGLLQLFFHPIPFKSNLKCAWLPLMTFTSLCFALHNLLG